METLKKLKEDYIEVESRLINTSRIASLQDQLLLKLHTGTKFSEEEGSAFREKVFEIKWEEHITFLTVILVHANPMLPDNRKISEEYVSGHWSIEHAKTQTRDREYNWCGT